MTPLPMAVSGPFAIDEVPVVPWRNGGGTTRTLAVAPNGAGMEDFLWRVSLAEIRTSGKFSAFSGVERTILLWSGAGVKLRSPAWPDHALTEPFRPFHFRGEDEVECDLVAEPSEDLNFMIRRGRVGALVHSASQGECFNRAGDDMVVLCATGAILIQFAGHPDIRLTAGEFLCILSAAAEMQIAVQRPASTYVVCAFTKSGPQSFESAH